MESGKQVHIDVLESGIQPGCLGQPCNCLKYACILMVCASARQGRQLHAPVLGNGLFEGGIVVVTCLCTRIRSQVGMPRLLRMLSMDSMTRTWCWCSTAGQAAAWHGFWKKDYLKVIKKDSHIGGLCTNAFGKEEVFKINVEPKAHDCDRRGEDLMKRVIQAWLPASKAALGETACEGA